MLSPPTTVTAAFVEGRPPRVFYLSPENGRWVPARLGSPSYQPDFAAVLLLVGEHVGAPPVRRLVPEVA